MASPWAAELARQLYITASVMPRHETERAIADQLDAARRAGLEEAALCIESQNGHVASDRRYLAGEIRKLGDSTERGDAGTG
jgi:hypothetical protein